MSSILASFYASRGYDSRGEGIRMGLYEDFGEALPVDKREAFKAAISALDGAVKIDSR